MEKIKQDKTYIEFLAEAISNSLILFSLIKILIISNINVSNLYYFLILIFTMALLLIKGVDLVIRIGITLFSLYIFYFIELNNKEFFNAILSLSVIYLGLYFMIRIGFFRKKIDTKIIFNILALSLTIKLLYNYFYLIKSVLNERNLFIFFILFIFLLTIPILEDVGRLIISFFGSIDIIIFLDKYLSLISIGIILISISIYFSIIYKLRIR